MDVRKDRMRERTTQFAVRVYRLSSALSKTRSARGIADQILRSGTSVGAHYAESCRARSKADFINKIFGAMQELEETICWLRVIETCELMTPTRLSALRAEMTELTAIFVTMVKNSRAGTAS